MTTNRSLSCEETGYSARDGACKCEVDACSHLTVTHVRSLEMQALVRGILPNGVDEDKDSGPSKSGVERFSGALNAHVYLKIMAIAFEVDAVEGVEDR